MISEVIVLGSQIANESKTLSRKLGWSSLDTPGSKEVRFFRAFIFRSLPSGVYDLRLDPRSEVVAVYCEMGNSECGSGGWTLAMKIDGAKVRFFLDSTTFFASSFSSCL